MSRSRKCRRIKVKCSQVFIQIAIEIGIEIELVPITADPDSDFDSDFDGRKSEFRCANPTTPVSVISEPPLSICNLL